MQTKIGTAFMATLAAIALAAAPAAMRPASAEEATATAEHPDAKMVAEGKALYTHHCAHCHGFNMVNPGPSPTTCGSFRMTRNRASSIR